MDAAKPNPKHLALWSLAGSALAASAFFTTMLPYASFDHMQLIVFLVPSAAGTALWTLAERRLKRRYRAGVWSEEELAPTRAMLSHPAMLWATISLFAVGLAVAVFSRHHATLFYITTVPMSALSSMRMALAPPKQSKGGLIDWKNFKPIRSDHWGEPVRHGSDSALPL